MYMCASVATYYIASQRALGRAREKAIQKTFMIQNSNLASNNNKKKDITISEVPPAN